MHDWRNFFNHVENSLDKSTYRIFEPKWKAEILHWFSREDVVKKQKEEFIQALIDFDDGCGDFYRYRAYFLACEALAQFPDCSFSDRIIEQLLKWSYGYFRQDKRDWQILPQPLVKTARATLELTDKKRVVAAFVQLVHATESRTIMRLAADKLGQLDPGNKSAIAAKFFLKPLAEDTPTFSKESCTHKEIVSVDESAIATLSKRLETSQSDYECLQAANSLLQVDSSNQIAINALFKVVKNLGQSPKYPDDAQYIAFQATISLRQIDPSHKLAINALVQLIRTAQDHSYLNLAVQDLGLLGAGNEVAIVTLIELISSTQDDYLLCDAACSLEKIDPGNKIVIAALLNKIETVQDECFRRRAAFHLGEFDPGNKVAISTLSHILENTQEQWEHFYAAQNLVKIDPGNPKAIATLCQIRENSQDKSINLQAAESLQDAVQNLKQLDLSNKLVKDKLNEVISILIRFVQTFDNPTTQLYYESCLLDIAQSLTKIPQSEHLPQVVIALKEYLSEEFYKNCSYRFEAVFNIIWHWAENMTYPEFYKAWHS